MTTSFHSGFIDFSKILYIIPIIVGNSSSALEGKATVTLFDFPFDLILTASTKSVNYRK
jgi:hypothetical protein